MNLRSEYRNLKPIDIRKLIRKKGYAIKSRFPNAVIDQHFLPYNFYPKREWPY